MPEPKPSQILPEWASNHTEAPEGSSGASNDVIDPGAAYIADGWPKAPAKPIRQFSNWTLKRITKHIRWLYEAFPTHVHSGGSAANAAPKIDLANHIAWGQEGEMEVIEDSNLEHHVDHRSTGNAVTRFTSEVVEALRFFRLHVASGNDYVDLEKESGLAGALQLFWNAQSGGRDVGMRMDALHVTRSKSPGGGFGTLHPEDTSLYVDNLTKVVMVHRFYVDSNETINNSQVEGYNIGGNWVSDGTDGWKLSPSAKANILGAALVSVGKAPEGADDSNWLAEAWWHPGEEVVKLRLYFYDDNSDSWLNLRSSPSPPNTVNIYVNTIVF